MRNWLGQDIQVGSVVYRGARAGNTSSFSVGVVSRLDEDKGKVRVDWKYGPSNYIWRKRNPTDRAEWLDVGIPGRLQGSGSPGIDSVVLIDVDFDLLEDKLRLAERWKEYELTTQEITDMCASLDSMATV